jgi:hypothetical protein
MGLDVWRRSPNRVFLEARIVDDRVKKPMK